MEYPPPTSSPPASPSPASSSPAPASALASLGGTRVLASVSLQVGVPSLATPSDGDIEVAVRFAPFSSSSSSTNSKQPAERATVLSETFRDLLLKGRVVSLADLCIEERRCAWKVCVAVLILNDDGGVFDAGLVAAVAALSGVRLPATLLDDEGVVKMRRGEPSTRLPLQTWLVPLTCGVFGPRGGGEVGEGGGGGGVESATLLADLSSAEEELVEATISVVCDGEGRVCGLFKPGGAAVAPAVLARCVALCTERGAGLRDVLGAREDGGEREGGEGGGGALKRRRKT